MVALKKHKGVVWNLKTNESAFITIPDPKKFMQVVIRTITKRMTQNVEFDTNLLNYLKKISEINCIEFGF